MSANLADVILRAPQDTFPYTQSPDVFSSYNLNDLAKNRFSDFRPVQLHHNLTMYLGGPGDDQEEIKQYIEGTFSGIYYTNKDRIKGYDPIEDKKLADIKLFVSYDGAYLLKQHEALQSVASDQIAIFLEIPEGDIFSDTVLLVKAGSKAKEYAKKLFKHEFITEKYNLTEKQVELLLSSLSSGQSFLDMIIGVAVSVKDFVVEGVSDLGAYVFGGISDLIANNLRIKRSIWDSSDPEYGLGKLEDSVLNFLKEKDKSLEEVLNSKSILIQGVSFDLPDWVLKIFGVVSKISSGIIVALEEVKEYLEANFAFICGLWNGLVDLLSGIFALIKLLFQGIGAANSYSNNEAYYQSLVVEYLDNFLQAALEIKWGEVVKTVLKAQFDLFLFILLIPGKILNSLENINYSKIAYYTGYIVFQIIELIFPPIKLAKVGKVDDFIKVIQKGIGIAFDASKKGAEQVTRIFFELISQFIARLKKGTKEVTKIIQDIYASIKKWLDDLLKTKKVRIRGGGDLNKSYFENAGIKTSKVAIKGKVIGQTTDHTCVATSLRMHLNDLSDDLSEAYLATELGTKIDGASILDIPKALFGLRREHILTDARKSISFKKLEEFLKQGKKAIVSVSAEGFGGHAVLIEGIKKGKVIVRDPLPINQGAAYSVDLKDFKRIFAEKAVIFL